MLVKDVRPGCLVEYITFRRAQHNKRTPLMIIGNVRTVKSVDNYGVYNRKYSVDCMNDLGQVGEYPVKYLFPVDELTN